MRIFLVRVSQRADHSLYLEHKPNATTDDDYVAISHVWGTPETVEDTVVDGHPGVVKLSPGKRDILSILSRPDICGSHWFWMDLFCIDQTESATISIADQLMSISDVYKSSRCVKVLLEHPICADWQATAMDFLNSNDRLDIDTWFDIDRKEFEHIVLCGPHVVCFDPCFERLWTRQEGLYGKVLDIVPLNLIPCTREQNQFDEEYTSWSHRNFLPKSTGVTAFLQDKLAYNGVQTVHNSELSKASLNFVYRRHLDMAEYTRGIGLATHDPLGSAWKSGRTTTKPRDYVLAVFPDVPGYILPPDMRTMTFPDLVANALSQAAVQQRHRIVPKVLSGMMKGSAEMSLRESMAPWIFEQPNNVGEAYDSFRLIPLALHPTRSAAEEVVYCVCGQITVEEVQLGRGEVQGILKLCTETMHNQHQENGMPYTFAHPKDQMSTERGVLHWHLWENLVPSDAPGDAEQQAAYTGDIDYLNDVPEAVLAEELPRFLVSMICGTSLAVADVILRHASPCVLSTPVGKTLAVVRLEGREAHRQTPQELQLILPPLIAYQGFLVASQTSTGATTVIGRTVIPSKTFAKAIFEEGRARGSLREVLG